MRLNNKIYTCLIILILMPQKFVFCKKSSMSAITYWIKKEGKWGRFGDHVLTYIKSKYLAYKYKLPFYYFPFEYCDDLMISELEKKLTDDVKKGFKKFVKVSGGHKIKRNANHLYASTLGSRVGNYRDKKFLKELRKTLAPIEPIEEPNIPEGRISVAVHVRKGGGYDRPLLSRRRWTSYADKNFPFKFPPDKYYIDQIKKLYEILNKRPMHVHIFTDDRAPEKIVEKYKKALKITSITFSCREKGNYHNKNVLQDFFAMTRFDCLIRSKSHFSVCADIIGDFAIVISPTHFKWRGDTLIIDKVNVSVRREINN